YCSRAPERFETERQTTEKKGGIGGLEGRHSSCHEPVGVDGEIAAGTLHADATTLVSGLIQRYSPGTVFSRRIAPPARNPPIASRRSRWPVAENSSQGRRSVSSGQGRYINALIC